jgi:hypothetical protein
MKISIPRRKKKRAVFNAKNHRHYGVAKGIELGYGNPQPKSNANPSGSHYWTVDMTGHA